MTFKEIYRTFIEILNIADWEPPFAYENEFSKIVGEVEDGDFVYVKTVKLCDLDVNRHMNNVVYTEIALNCFSADFLCDKKFNSYEVHFLKEAREGDNIKVYKKEESGGFVVVGKNDNGENYFKASIDFEKM